MMVPDWELTSIHRSVCMLSTHLSTWVSINCNLLMCQSVFFSIDVHGGLNKFSLCSQMVAQILGTGQSWQAWRGVAGLCATFDIVFLWKRQLSSP